ncbi:MAG: hypothetical protein ABIR33_05075 [Pyrinomonadaceae bacterium]
MDLANDLSNDVVLAVLVEGRLGQKLAAEDAKTFISLLESELSRISLSDEDQGDEGVVGADLSH